MQETVHNHPRVRTQVNSALGHIIVTKMFLTSHNEVTSRTDTPQEVGKHKKTFEFHEISLI